VRTRIQNPEYRIQNGAQPAGANVAPTACTGSKTGNMNHRERRLAARERIEQRAKRSLEPISGVERELPRCGLEANRGGKRRGLPTIGGQEVGKWTGFSHFETALTHLFPHDSTQVVDFPRMYVVSIFRGRAKNSRISGRGMIGRGMAKRGLGTNIGTCRVDFCGKITGCYAKVREVSRKSTKVRTDQARNSAMLRIVTVGLIFWPRIKHRCE